MSITKANYLSDHFNENRIDFLHKLKKATELIIQKKNIVYEDDDFTASILRGENSALIIVDNKNEDERVVYIKDYEGKNSKDVEDDELINLYWVKHYKEEGSLDKDSFCRESKAFSYKVNFESKENNAQNKMKKLKEFMKREDADKIWAERVNGKDVEEQRKFSIEYGVDEKLMPILENADYFNFLKTALKNEKEYITAQTLDVMRLYIKHLNDEKYFGLSLEESDYKAMNKYGSIYGELIYSWGITFEEIELAFKAQGITSEKIGKKLKLRNSMWIEDNKIIMKQESYDLIIDLIDSENYDVYVSDNSKQNYEDFLQKLKNNNIDPLTEVAISLRDKEIINANPINLYLLDLDVRFGYKDLLEAGILEERKEKYNYEYFMKYMATVYGASELNMLYRAFVGLGTGIEYSVEHGAFYDKQMGKIDNTSNYKAATKEFEKGIYIIQPDLDNLKKNKLDNLNNDWHKGLKKLINNYDANQENIDEEGRIIFDHVGDENFVEKKLKELHKVMKKLKKIDKQLDEKKAKLLSSLKM